MSPFLFWIFALLMLVFGAGVIINRNPVASALNLVVSFLGLAALFLSLDAYFIAIIQVLVYAGAIMVLFLFIIMLLDLRAEKRRKINWVALAGGIVVALAFLVQLFSVVGMFGPPRKIFRRSQGRQSTTSTTSGSCYSRIIICRSKSSAWSCSLPPLAWSC